MLFLTTKFRKALALVIALALLLGITYWKGCQRGHQTHSLASSNTAPEPSATLPVNDKERISVNLAQNRVTVQTHKDTQVVSGVRNATITIDNAGNVSVVAKPYGFTFEPGIFGAGSLRGTYIGVDSCVAYYHRLDLLTGVGVSSRNQPFAIGYVGIGYAPTLVIFSNTDFFVGYATNQSIVAGIRVGF